MTGLSRSLFQVFNRRWAIHGQVSTQPGLHVGPGTRIWSPTGLEIGSNVYLGKRCTVEVDGRIGSGTLIANNVGIVGRRDHDHHQVGVPIRQARWCGDGDGAYLCTRVDIGDDVWIGYGAVVLAPVTIGRGAIVAAGAIVTSDVAAYEIVAGNPASSIGRRFDNEQIKRHELELERLKSS